MTPDDENYIGYTITDVARLMRTVFERRVRAFGLTRAQWLVIARVHRRPGLEPIGSRRPAGDREGPGRPADRPHAGQGLARAPRRQQRPPRQPAAPDRRRQSACTPPSGRSRKRPSTMRWATSRPKERRQLTGLMTRVKAKLQALAEHDPRAPSRAPAKPQPTKTRRAHHDLAAASAGAEAGAARGGAGCGRARRRCCSGCGAAAMSRPRTPT